MSKDVTETWFEEQLHSSLVLRVRIDTLLYQEETEHQKLIIFDNHDMGRVLGLDNVVQTTSKDEHIYHEMLVHPALLARVCWQQRHQSDDTLDVLIIGGGDGGCAREVLKYPHAHATMVDIDRRVIDLCVRYLPNHSAGAFDDERLTLIIDDGARYVQICKKRFDAVIIDSTDPIGPGKQLFTQDFFAACRGVLKRGGVLINQNGVPFLQPTIAHSHKSFQNVFSDHTFYFASVPTYVGGVMAFGWACDEPTMRQWNEQDLAAAVGATRLTTRYYTPKVGLAAFVMPPDIAASMV